jgi:hypothetical protein
MWSLVGSTDLNTLQFTHQGIAANQDLQYKIRAVTEAGDGQFSIRNTFVIASRPTILQAPLMVEQTAEFITM